MSFLNDKGAKLEDVLILELRLFLKTSSDTVIIMYFLCTLSLSSLLLFTDNLQNNLPESVSIDTMQNNLPESVSLDTMQNNLPESVSFEDVRRVLSSFTDGVRCFYIGLNVKMFK